MKIFDTHCDALLKLQIAKRNTLFDGEMLDYRKSNDLETNFERLQAGGVKVQFFAIFIHPEFPSDEKWQHALEQVDLFYSEILGKNPYQRMEGH